MHHSHERVASFRPGHSAVSRLHRLRHGLGYYLVETYTDVVASKLLRRRSNDRGRGSRDLWSQ